MNTQKWPNQMELKMSEQYLTEKNGGHRIYTAATLRRMFVAGEIKGIQAGKGKKIRLYRSELDLKILGRNLA